jgi:hypothetical protein
MIFLTAAATKGAQRNKGPDHKIQVVDPLLSPYPPYWLWPVLKSAANYLLTHFEKRHGADPLKSAYSTIRLSSSRATAPPNLQKSSKSLPRVDITS